MASVVKSESFENATIDINDMTITEYGRDDTKSYSLLELLKRWDGIPNITLSVRKIETLPPDGRDEA